MTPSTDELARELIKLENTYRAYARSPEYTPSELWHPTPCGFMAKYQRRVKQIQRAMAARQ